MGMAVGVVEEMVGLAVALVVVMGKAVGMVEEMKECIVEKVEEMVEKVWDKTEKVEYMGQAVEMVEVMMVCVVEMFEEKELIVGTVEMEMAEGMAERDVVVEMVGYQVLAGDNQESVS